MHMHTLLLMPIIYASVSARGRRPRGTYIYIYIYTYIYIYIYAYIYITENLLFFVDSYPNKPDRAPMNETKWAQQVPNKWAQQRPNESLSVSVVRG